LGFGTSLGQIIVPVLGCAALGESLRLSAMLGPVGLQIAGALVAMGSAVFGATWLGARIFPATPASGLLLDLPVDRRANGRDLTTAFGALLALDMLRRVAMAEVAVSDAATSVLSLPVILAGAYILVRLGRLMRQTQAAIGEQGSVTYRNRLLDLLARGVILFGTIGPILAVLGYISAAAQLVFPTALTLGLVALLYLIQWLISEVYGLLMRTEDEQDTLVPVLISFALALAMLPAVALIWGARVSDLTELWTRFTVVSVTGYVGIFVAALVAINSSGIDLSGIAIVAGALSVGIGFGLQTVVSNFVSGIILLIERPISEGDWIEVGPVQGIVSAISVRSTRIQTFDRSDVIVPNSDLISGRVTNWTRFSLTGRVIVAVSVPYTEDSRRVAKILREIAEAQPMVLLSPPPLVAFMGFAAEMMQFELRVILRDVNFQVEVRSEINHQIAARFRAEAIPFTSAHRDHLQRLADERAAEAEALAQEAAQIAAVEAILAAPMPAPLPAGKPK
jgi:small-conductance mechanosensitive channel